MIVELKDEMPAERYPMLMISIGDKPGQVVLFTDDCCGVCLVVGSTTDWSVGEWHTGWDMKRFTPFNGTVTLSND